MTTFAQTRSHGIATTSVRCVQLHSIWCWRLLHKTFTSSHTLTLAAHPRTSTRLSRILPRSSSPVILFSPATTTSGIPTLAAQRTIGWCLQPPPPQPRNMLMKLTLPSRQSRAAHPDTHSGLVYTTLLARAPSRTTFGASAAMISRASPTTATALMQIGTLLPLSVRVSNHDLNQTLINLLIRS